MNKVVKNWIATSNYDLQTADAMYKTGRYLYVVFMCHLSIEKLLKAILAHKDPDDLPPKMPIPLIPACDSEGIRHGVPKDVTTLFRIKPPPPGRSEATLVFSSLT